MANKKKHNNSAYTCTPKIKTAFKLWLQTLDDATAHVSIRDLIRAKAQ